jgi:hypothetical protein
MNNAFAVRNSEAADVSGVIHVALVDSVNRPHVRFASESDRIAV